MIGEIAGPHFFVAVIVRRIARIDHDVPVVVRGARIIAPDIGLAYLMKGVIGPWRQRCIVGINFANSKDPGRRSTITLVFAQPLLTLSSDPTAPGQSFLAKQHRERSGFDSPLVVSFVEQIQMAPHRIPVWRNANDELFTILRQRSGTSVAG